MNRRTNQTGQNRKKEKKRRYLAVTAGMIFLLALAALLMLHRGNENPAEEYTQKAKESYNAGDYETALLYLRRIRPGEEQADSMMLMADCYEAMGNYARALETLRRMNTADPAVTARIQAIEQKRSQMNREGLVQFAGMEFDPSVRSAALDEKGINDEQLKGISVLYMLDTLSLSGNSITDVSPLKNLGGLEQLDLSGNQIRDVSALSSLGSLRSLKLNDNPLTDCSPLCRLGNLRSLQLAGTPVSEESLKMLAEALPACAIRYTREETDEIIYSGERFPADVKELILRHRSLQDISGLEVFSELRVLDLSGNQISDIRPLMKLAALEKLNLSENEISDLRPLIGLPEIRILDVSNNQIRETSTVGALKKLEELNLSGNPVSDFTGLEKLGSLRILNLQNTGVRDAVLPGLSAIKGLQNLDLRGNSGLSDKAIGALQYALKGCTIVTPSLIYEIDFCGHHVRSNERKLSFPKGGISDLSGLERMTSLEELDLSGNEIEGLYLFEMSPSRTVLRKLNLEDNRITDILPLCGCSMLEELDLSGNQIGAVIGLGQLTALRRLDLRGNPVLPDQLQALKEALSQCDILYSE